MSIPYSVPCVLEVVPRIQMFAIMVRQIVQRSSYGALTETTASSTACGSPVFGRYLEMIYVDTSMEYRGGKASESHLLLGGSTVISRLDLVRKWVETQYNWIRTHLAGTRAR